jgi:hypothetical protein
MPLPNPQHHYVLAMLSLPRSTTELGRWLAGDRAAPFEAAATVNALAEQAAGILGQLEEQDYVRNLGTFPSADAALTAIGNDDSLVQIPEEKAENYVERVGGRDAYKLREGDLWYWTGAGRDALLS